MLLWGLAGGCEAPADDVALSESALLEASEEAASAADTSGLTVKVKQGHLHGKLVGDTRVFLGIPYGKPPVGERRFALPEAADGWSGTREAVAFGPVCPQPAGALSAPGVQSEDCLNLNVYAPPGATKKSKLPVMVFIHGGAFVAGGSTSYDGVKLSTEGDLVVVTLNYRLGALGFLAHPELDKERHKHTPSGNDAFRDQQLALEWVRANIDSFGGDPKDVTLFGESAGAMSTCLHMVSSTSKKLADRYIMESGSCVAGLPIIKKDAAHTIGTNLANALCAEATDVVACLRGKPAAEVVAWGAASGISGAGWGPVINANDKFLPVHPLLSITLGAWNKAPFITGSNANEWGLFQLIGASPVLPTVAAYNAALEAQFGAAVATLIKLQYPVTTDAAANPTFVRLMTDAVFRCPARTLARIANLQGVPTYLYSFDHSFAYHAFELPYVFGNPNPRLGAPVLDEALRNTVQTYWTQFATTGSPNVSGQPTWPTHNLLTDRHMSLKSASAVGSGLARSECDFWSLLQAIPQ